MSRIQNILIIALVFITMNAFAQNADTVIKNNTIEITQSYQPEIKQNPKPVLHPILPPADTTHPVFTYDVPQQTLLYTYNSTPLRPLALGKDSSVNEYNHYLKLGGGNLSTLLFDYGEDSKGKNIFNTPGDGIVHLRSLSQKGDIANMQTWLLDGEISGTVYGKDKLWRPTLSFLRNQFYDYGYDHAIYQYDAGQVIQTYTGVRAGVDMRNTDEALFNYAPGIFFSSYSGTNNNTTLSEGTLYITVPVSYALDTTIQLKASVNATVTQNKIASASTTNNIFQFSPGIEFHKDAISAHAYICPTAGKDKSYILPDIAAAYKIPSGPFVISAGWKGALIQNSYQQLSTENPYLSPLYTIAQTRSNEVFGNVNLGLGPHITLTGRISFWQYDQMPLFVNDFADPKHFDVVYDSQLNATSILLAAKYQVGNTFSADLSITSFSFSNGTLPQTWHVPTQRIKGSVSYRPVKELYITAYFNVLGGINAVDSTGKTVALNNTLDLGFYSEYNFINRLSVFVQANNLLNNKNERWLGYASYGFNIFGGVRLKF